MASFNRRCRQKLSHGIHEIGEGISDPVGGCRHPARIIYAYSYPFVVKKDWTEFYPKVRSSRWVEPRRRPGPDLARPSAKGLEEANGRISRQDVF